MRQDGSSTARATLSSAGCFFLFPSLAAALESSQVHHPVRRGDRSRRARRGDTSILDALAWCEVTAAGELTLSAYEARLRER